MSSSPYGVYVNDAERQCDQLRSLLACSRVEEIIDSGLHEFVDVLQLKINDIGAAIHDSFFATCGVSPPDSSGNDVSSETEPMGETVVHDA
jgi:uncharacterized alpha-E superfamily protein